jgi:hypothetical protein
LRDLREELLVVAQFEDNEKDFTSELEISQVVYRVREKNPRRKTRGGGTNFKFRSAYS